MRQLYRMTDEQHDELLAACQPVPAIMLQCGMPPSPQENANAAWKKLGDVLGFDHMTVRAVHGDKKAFSAEPTEPAE
jgi:hypothetical protein